MVRLGHYRMGKKKGGTSPAAVAPEAPAMVQTPTAGGASTGSPPDSNLKLEDVPVSRGASPMLNTPAGSRPGTSSTVDSEKTKEIMAKVDSATKTMEMNIQAATQRGESLNELQDKTQAVAESSKQFSKNAKTVKRNLWWKDIKFTLILVFVLLCLAGGIGLMISMQSK